MAIGSASTDSVLATGRGVRETLAGVRAVVEPARRAAIDSLPAEVRHIAGYHAGWWEVDGRPREGSGKALRSALVLTCARAAGGDLDSAIPAAVAVELAHDFTLLHDDVMDGDQIRRQRPAVWTVFGVNSAILAGDVLVTLAVQQLGSVMAMKVLSAALLDLCAGQAADLAFETRTDVSLSECLKMAEHKTGALLGAACQLGAIAAQADEAVSVIYQAFGRRLGVAFQLVDDLLGIWGDPQTTGKPTGADLAAGKKTLPIVAALTSSSSAGQQLADLYRPGRTLTHAELARAAHLVEAAGGRAWAQAEADRNMTEALSLLRKTGPLPAAADELTALARFIVHRDH